MAKNDNLTDYLVDLADGIRAKKGTTEPINPQDFRKEIESISGGGESGGSNWRYFRCSSPSAYNTYFIGVYSIVRVENPQFPDTVFVDSGVFGIMEQQGVPASDSATAMAINMGMRVTNTSTIELSTIGEIYGEVINQMETAGVLTEITEAEFYDLNA